MDPRPVEDLLQSLGLPMPRCNKVLLVDDEFEVLAVLEALLEDDFDVQTAQGGAEALEILEAQSDLDLVITDQRMPGLTGVELLAIISERWPDIYRIVLTAYSDVDPIVFHSHFARTELPAVAAAGDRETRDTPVSSDLR